LQRGARPVLAGRDRGRLGELAARLGQAGGGTQPETAVAEAAPGPLRDLIGPGDVLVSTAGPFLKVGRPAVAAAVDAGAIYLDSAGEPPFIRQVFEEFGPRAERAGAVLLTAFGYDKSGNLAGALALDAAGPAAARVQVGYFVRGKLGKAASAGTRASVAGVLLEGGYAFRGGRVVSERTAAHVTSFEVDGQRKEAFSIGSSEHFGLPRLRPRAAEPAVIPGQAPLTDVGVYLGWFGRAARLVQCGSALAVPAGRLPGVRRSLNALARRIQRSRTGPASQTIRSDVVAVARDASGSELAAVHLTGGDPYSFTAPILAWAAAKAAAGGVRPAGALGPVEAFGTADLEAAAPARGSIAWARNLRTGEPVHIRLLGKRLPAPASTDPGCTPWTLVRAQRRLRARRWEALMDAGLLNLRGATATKTTRRSAGSVLLAFSVAT
jgi:short subunit dehydrogenase-like uncharacterized protein